MNSKEQERLHQRGTEFATHGEKESAQKGISANTSTLNQRTPKRQLRRPMPNNRPKHRPSPKQQPKKGDKGAEESEAEVETVYHDRDAEDAMTESSRWSGETDIPEKYVWFQEILDDDVSEELEYLKSEDEQWRTNSMWYKGFFDDVQQSSSKPVNAKTFKAYDH